MIQNKKNSKIQPKKTLSNSLTSITYENQNSPQKKNIPKIINYKVHSIKTITKLSVIKMNKAKKTRTFNPRSFLIKEQIFFKEKICLIFTGFFFGLILSFIAFFFNCCNKNEKRYFNVGVVFGFLLNIGISFFIFSKNYFE